MTTHPALEVDQLVVRFGHGAGAVEVLHAVDLALWQGQTVGLVGESGSGKSTLAKAVVGVVPVASGTVRVDGQDLATMPRRERQELVRALQLIPQDPYSSLNPRRTIGQTMAEALDPVRARVREHRDRIAHWLELVKLPVDALDRFPHEFSGGQRQRIAIARALVTEPRIVIADEITSALDVSVQAEILQLLDRLRHELDLTMLFISHNLAVVRQVCDEVAVLFQGDLVEHGPSRRVFDEPEHDYTQRLLASVPGSPTFSLA
jgi:ABC-type glutathione transport system ATPase component